MRGWLLVVALLTLLAAGCQGDTGGADDEAPSVPDATPERILTADGLTLDARLFPADSDRIVILLHMYQANQESWFETARLLRDRGISALTLDFRGYGRSEGDVEPADIDKDVRAALEHVRSRGYDRVVLVGASMGGTAAIVAAAGEDVDGVVTLSAPGSFRGLDADAAAAELESPLAMIAAAGDVSAEQTVSTFEAKAYVDPKWSRLVEGNAHGTELLSSEEGHEVQRMLFEFLDEVWADED